MLRQIIVFLVVFVAGLATAVGIYYYFEKQAEVKMTAALEQIRSEELLFLVTRRVTLTVVLEKKDNSLILGSREGLIWGDVAIYYGFDLQKTATDAIYRDGDTLVIELPEPEILDLAVDLESLRFYTKQSLLSITVDKFANADLREELRRSIAAEALELRRRRSLLPSGPEMLRKMNEFGIPYLEKKGIKARFVLK